MSTISFEQAVANKLAEDKTSYEQAVERARIQALAQWEREYPAKKAELYKKIEAHIKSVAEQADENGDPVAAADLEAEEQELYAQADAKLEKEKEEYLEMAVSMVEQPMTKEQIEEMFSFLREFEGEPELEQRFVNINLKEIIYNIGNEYYSVAQEKFITEPEDKTTIVVPAGPATRDNLKEVLKFYNLPVGTELLSTEELLDRIREIRKLLLVEYDNKVMQLNRLIRENPSDSDTYLAQRIAWDEYATALVALTDEGREGSPWDGGGTETPWPERPL